jgi:hypothetical protein
VQVTLKSTPRRSLRGSLLEVCLDRGGTYRGRIARQMEGHREAMETGALSEALKVQRGNRLLAVFESAASRDAVRDRLRAQTPFAAFAPLFLFAVLDDVCKDFGGGWSDLNSQPVAL